MLSTCPSCLSQVSHPDHLFDVTCECGTHFSPFLNVDSGQEAGKPNENVNSFAEYAESNAAFEDIRSFGEGLSTDENAPVTTPASKITKPPPLKTPKTEPVEKTAVEGLPLPSDFVITRGSTLQGYGIDAYFPPVSFWADLEPTDQNPMNQAFATLTEVATKAGANAVLDLHWMTSPDCTRVLITGTPVHCAKI